MNRPKSDRHVRVAFEHLSDPNVFDEAAKAGSRKELEQARDTWRRYDADPRRKKLKHYRDKVVAYTAVRELPMLLVSELTSYAMGTAEVLARLPRGTGVITQSQLGVQTAAKSQSEDDHGRPLFVLRDG